MSKKKLEPEFALVTIAAPIAPEPPTGYCSRHLDVQLDTQQAQTLARLLAGMDKADTRLASGSRVYRQGDVVRWLLEQAAGDPASRA